MAKVYAMIADGTEEVECLAVVDLLRRSKIDTVLVAAKEDREVVTSHGIRIQADAAVGEVDFSDADVIFLPGGMPGSVHLSQCEPLIQALKAQNQAGKRIAAICAAPAVVLGHHGLLRGKRGSSYGACRARVSLRSCFAECFPFRSTVQAESIHYRCTEGLPHPGGISR